MPRALEQSFQRAPPPRDRCGEIGFGVTYTNGENPDEGLQQQAFWQVMLKFRIKKS